MVHSITPNGILEAAKELAKVNSEIKQRIAEGSTPKVLHELTLKRHRLEHKILALEKDDGNV